MKRFFISHIWWITLLIAVAMLLAHTFSYRPVKVDSTSIILILVIFLSPFISAITKIKIGEFEAQIDPKEVQRIKAEVSTKITEDAKPVPTQQAANMVDSIKALVESDPILALAKLRIELEKALRKLYQATYKIGIAVQNRPLSAGQLVTILSNAEILPPEVAGPIREVISICNRAIHGEDIRQQDAESIVEIGTSLLSELSSDINRYGLQSIETIVVDQATVDDYLSAKYRVTTIIPLVENPVKDVRILDREGLNDLLEGYDQDDEFVIEVVRLDAKNQG